MLYSLTVYFKSSCYCPNLLQFLQLCRLEIRVCRRFDLQQRARGSPSVLLPHRYAVLHLACWRGRRRLRHAHLRAIVRARAVLRLVAEYVVVPETRKGRGPAALVMGAAVVGGVPQR